MIRFVLLLCLLAPVSVRANTLSWQYNSTIESGFAIEMLTGGKWSEVGRVGVNVTTWSDVFTEGVYRVRAFISVAGGPDVFSAYSNTAIKINGPINANVQ
jgi:hypothetical protein